MRFLSICRRHTDELKREVVTQSLLSDDYEDAASVGATTAPLSSQRAPVLAYTKAPSFCAIVRLGWRWATQQRVAHGNLGNSESSAARAQIAQLQRMFGKKTMGAEILRNSVRQKWIARSPYRKWTPAKPVCAVLDVARSHVVGRLARPAD